MDQPGYRQKTMENKLSDLMSTHKLVFQSGKPYFKVWILQGQCLRIDFGEWYDDWLLNTNSFRICLKYENNGWVAVCKELEITSANPIEEEKVFTLADRINSALSNGLDYDFSNDFQILNTLSFRAAHLHVEQ